MPITGIEHVNIRTDRVPETIGFFRDALGMDVRCVPGSDDMKLGAWVYGTDGTAVVHIGSVRRIYPGETQAPGVAQDGAGTIHHVALACADYDGMRDRIAAANIDATANDVPQFNLRQLFLHDPNNVLIELNFHGA